MIKQDCMGKTALELTSMAVFDENTLPEYVHERTKDLRPAEMVELVTLLAAVAGATYEAWAEAIDVDVSELLSRAGLHFATHSIVDDTDDSLT